MHADNLHSDGLDLSPVVIAAFGHPARPAERLIGLQATVGRVVAWVAGLCLPRRSIRTVGRATRLFVKS